MKTKLLLLSITNNLNLNVMKKTFLFLLIIATLAIAGCKEKHKIDKQFVGRWHNVENPDDDKEYVFYENGRMHYGFGGVREWWVNETGGCIGYQYLTDDYGNEYGEGAPTGTIKVNIIIEGREVEFDGVLYKKTVWFSK